MISCSLLNPYPRATCVVDSYALRKKRDRMTPQWITDQVTPFFMSPPRGVTWSWSSHPSIFGFQYDQVTPLVWSSHPPRGDLIMLKSPPAKVLTKLRGKLSRGVAWPTTRLSTQFADPVYTWCWPSEHPKTSKMNPKTSWLFILHGGQWQLSLLRCYNT